MAGEIELLTRLYDRFNARDINTVLAALREDVVWANGMEGGHVCGHDGVRDYWTRQWAKIDPHVEPIGFSVGPGGTINAEVRQTVRDLGGNILSERTIGHIFRIEGSLIKRFDIRRSAGEAKTETLPAARDL